MYRTLGPRGYGRASFHHYYIPKKKKKIVGFNSLKIKHVGLCSLQPNFVFLLAVTYLAHISHRCNG
jgi:hypothetical protein